MEAIKELNDSMLGLYGELVPTLINGLPTNVIWNLAEIGRIHQLLDESDWYKPAYELLCSADILGTPISVANGMEVQRQGDVDWKFVIRRIDPPAVTGTEYVQLVVVAITRF